MVSFVNTSYMLFLKKNKKIEYE